MAGGMAEQVLLSGSQQAESTGRTGREQVSLKGVSTVACLSSQASPPPLFHLFSIVSPAGDLARHTRACGGMGSI